VAYFYQGLPTASSARPDGAGRDEFLGTAEGVELACWFPRIPRASVRRQLLDLVRTMADNPEEHSGDPPLGGT
jgi:hypothetical protein